MKWWDILKNAKVSGKSKSKGSSFDASKIKINIKEPEKCKEKLIQYSKNTKRVLKPHLYEIDTPSPFQYESGEEEWQEWQELPEEVACKVIKTIDSWWVLYPEIILSSFEERNFQSLLRRKNLMSVNLGKYVFRRNIEAHYYPDGKTINVLYSLEIKKPRQGEGRLVWYVHSATKKETGNLSNSELDWRK